jgi:N-acetyltransferase 10
MALFVSSHYKNSPNDLQLLSDAPNHLLFVLLPPIKEGAKEMTLPEPLVVLQVALEGRISKQSVMNSLARGIKAGGDLIPWTVSQQFQDDDFATLSGARIVRIATNPEFAKMGYGSRALSILLDFFSGKLLNLDEVAKKEVGEDFKSASKVDKVSSMNAYRVPTEANALFARMRISRQMFQCESEIRPRCRLSCSVCPK